MPLKLVLFLWATCWLAPLKIHNPPGVCQSSVYLISDGMETNLFISEHTLQTYNKIKWKTHFIWEFKVKFSYDVTYFYFIQAMQQKCVITHTCTRTLLINGCKCLMVHARNLDLFLLKSGWVLLLTTTKYLVLLWT